MNIFLLTLGQLVNSKLARTLDAFCKLTSKEAINEGMPKLTEIINQFKTGDLDEKDFFPKMRKIIDPKDEKDLQPQKMISSWNLMSTMDQETIDDLKILSKLQSQNEIQLAVVSLTNATHIKHIDTQFSNAGIDLEYQRILSFKEETLSITRLIAKLVSTFEWDKSGNQVFSLLTGVETDQLFQHANVKTIPIKSEKISTIVQRHLNLPDHSDQKTTGSAEKKSNTPTPAKL